MGAATSSTPLGSVIGDLVTDVFDACGLHGDASDGGVGPNCGLVAVGRNISESSKPRKSSQLRFAKVKEQQNEVSSVAPAVAAESVTFADQSTECSRLHVEKRNEGQAELHSRPREMFSLGLSGLSCLAIGDLDGASEVSRCDSTLMPNSRCDVMSAGRSIKVSKDAKAQARVQELLVELFQLHDLNGDGQLDESELIKLNEKIAMLHHGKETNREAVKAKFHQLFRARLDSEGKPVGFDIFGKYMSDVVGEFDRDACAQELILEQYVAEARSGRLAFRCKSFESVTDAQYIKCMEDAPMAFPKHAKRDDSNC